MKDTDFLLFKEYLASFHSLPDTEWTEIISVLSKVKIPKNGKWVHSGGPGTDFGFVVSGLLRVYYTTYQGAEFTRNFRAEKELVAANSAALSGAPSDVTIEALEPTLLVVFPYKFMQRALTRHACWQEIWRKVSKAQYVAREKREYELLCLNARDRYESFMAEFGHLSSRISQRHIASFLGITPVSLSRLLKNMG